MAACQVGDLGGAGRDRDGAVEDDDSLLLPHDAHSFQGANGGTGQIVIRSAKFALMREDVGELAGRALRDRGDDHGCGYAGQSWSPPSTRNTWPVT